MIKTYDQRESRLRTFNQKKKKSQKLGAKERCMCPLSVVEITKRLPKYQIYTLSIIINRSTEPCRVTSNNDKRRILNIVIGDMDKWRSQKLL